MDGEVVEDQVLDLLERRPFEEAMVPVHREVGRRDLADEPRPDCLPDVAEVGRPAAVLIDGQLDALAVGQIDHPPAEIEVQDERLLAQHVLAG